MNRRDTISIDLKDVNDYINGLDIHKAAGPDNVNTGVLKEDAKCQKL